MKPLSPADAIAPAFSRARTILMPPGFVPGQNGPFRFGFFLKIALVAALTTSGFYGITFGFASQGISMATMGAGGGHRHGSLVAIPGMAAAMVAVAIAAGLVGLALWVFFGWIWCRLRFTLFDLIVYRHGRVGLAWSRYSRQSWRLLGLLVIVSLVFLVLVAVTAGPLILHLIATLRHTNPQEIGRNPMLLFAHLFPIYGILMVFGLVGSLVDAIIQDFLLPPMAIQNASPGAAIGRFVDLARDGFWSLVLYFILRFVMQIGLSWVGAMVILLVLGILGLGGAGAGFVLYRSLWHAGPAGIAVFLLYCVAAGLILVALYLLSMISLYGSVTTFRQSYAALYFGSHYPELGALLEPPLPMPAAPPPPVMPLGEPPPVW